MSTFDIWPVERKENEATDQIRWYALRCKKAGDTHEDCGQGARAGSSAPEADTRGLGKQALLLCCTWDTAGSRSLADRCRAWSADPFGGSCLGRCDMEERDWDGGRGRETGKGKMKETRIKGERKK